MIANILLSICLQFTLSSVTDLTAQSIVIPYSDSSRIATDPYAAVAQTEIEAAYTQTKAVVTRKRLDLAKAYKQANTDSARKSVLAATRRLFITSMVDEIVPYWYGTPWDYNGYTNTPRKGIVACGYFVSTTIKHAGIKVNRYELAKCYSRSIVEQMCAPESILTVRPDSKADLIAQIEHLPEDLYIVGLDNHVGFLLHENHTWWFIHSNYAEPFGVVREHAVDAQAFGSNTYVIGNLSNNPQLLKDWLQQRERNIVR